MIIEPADVLRMQADLRDRTGQRIVQTIIDSQYNDIHTPRPGDSEVPFALSLHQSLTVARAYRVERQMTEALWNRAHSLADEQHLGFPPVEHGFVVFEEPVRVWDAVGRTEIIHVITWSPVTFRLEKEKTTVPGVIISMWNDTSRDPDQVYEEVVMPEVRSNPAYARAKQSLGRWSMTNSGPFWPEWPVGSKTNPIDRHVKRRIVIRGETPAEYVPSLFRLFSALFSMLSERIPATNKTPAVLSRTETKQARRAGLAPEVILVTLRPEYREPTQRGTGHPISVRYPLGNPDDPNSVAFYRTIHKGTERERRVPVRAHWRGRPDAPVSPRKTVYNLAR